MATVSAEFIADDQIRYASATDISIEKAAISNLQITIINSKYVMRGYDTNLAKSVIWNSSKVDATASDYTTPGDISLPTVVVFVKKGS